MKQTTIDKANSLIEIIAKRDEHIKDVKKQIELCRQSKNFEVILSHSRNAGTNNFTRLNVANNDVEAYLDYYVSKFEKRTDELRKELEDLKDE